MVRRFTQKQHGTLFLAASGMCELCGAALEAGWHADHTRPYSKGGATVLENGQALCPSCNLKKGSRMNTGVLAPWPTSFVLRQWQTNAVLTYDQKDARDFLTVATPGAGKTVFALHIAHRLFVRATVARIVIVCPTDHLKRQWAAVAAKVGLNLDPRWPAQSDRTYSGLAPENRQYHGIVVTYAQVARTPDAHHVLCSRIPTFAIFDEIHHAGDGEELSWGIGVREGFKAAARRLCISGTPFRSDNNPIPYVDYNAEGKSVADFVYGYGEALVDDNVVRPVIFPSYDGTMEWSSHNGETMNATFRDEVTQRQSKERLRTALSVSGAWLPSIIKDAHRQLCNIRENGHSNAGGLIIAEDQYAAHAIAALVKDVTGDTPDVAVSEMKDKSDPSDTITRFDEGTNRWIVAVRMISEGVDIKRLRVCVYATVIETELFMRQAIGRIVRWVDNVEDGQLAYFFIPYHPPFIEIIQRIKQERDHTLELRPEERKKEGSSAGEGNPLASLFLMINAGDARPDDVFLDSDVITQREIAYVRTVIRPRIGAALGAFDDAVLAAAIRVDRAERSAPAAPLNIEPATPAPVPTNEEPLWKRTKQMRSRIKTKAGYLSHLLTAGNGYQVTVQDINTLLYDMTGKYSGDCSLDDLTVREQILIDKIQEAKRGKY